MDPNPTPNNPYEILGIDQNASPTRIRRAYCNLAKQHHPDHGGDADTFHRIQAAYDILSDPDRRRTYDETGSTDAPKPPSDMPPMDILGPSFMGAVTDTYNTDRDPAKTNIVQLAVESIERHIHSYTENIVANGKRIRHLKRIMGRTTAPGENYLESLLKSEHDKLKQNIDHWESEVKQLKTAVEYLRKCDYRIDPDPGAAARSKLIGDLGLSHTSMLGRAFLQMTGRPMMGLPDAKTDTKTDE